MLNTNKTSQKARMETKRVVLFYMLIASLMEEEQTGKWMVTAQHLQNMGAFLEEWFLKIDQDHVLFKNATRS